MIRSRLFGAGCVAAAILSVNSLARAADIYFDTVGGDDGKDGTTEANAKKTFKMPSGTGNTVHIKRGSTISGNLSVNNVTVVAYGCGPRPVVNGAINVSNATLTGIKAMPTAGVGISISSNSTVSDCESDGANDVPPAGSTAGCMGITINGSGNHVTGCYVHDFGFSQSGASMNNSGGAEGIMVMGSNNEISFCSVVNSYSPNKTLGGFEGGCYEIVNGKAGSTLSNISFHHNYCERSVGLFETSSGDFSSTGGHIQTNHGIVENVTVSYNISVDSMWLFLLQPVNTDFKNFVFSNNTIIHTKASKDYWTIPVSTDFPNGQAYNGGGHAAMALAVDTDTVTDSSGTSTKYTTENAYYSMSSGFQPGTVIVKNNIFVDDIGANDMMFMTKFADHSNNIIAPSNASVGNITLGSTEKKVNLADLGFTADYQLTSASTPAIDQGVAMSMNTTPMLASAAADSNYFGTVFTQDVTRHAVPCGSAVDIGASEYCDATPPSLPWPGASGANDCGAGGTSSTGGATSTGGSHSTGGASGATTGGKSATGGSSIVGTGGAPTTTTGGKAATGGSSIVGTGGKATTGGSSTVGAGGVVSNTGGASANNNTGGAAPTNTGGASVVANAGGQSPATVGGNSAVVGAGGAAAGAPGTAVSNTAPGGTAVDQGGCTCRVAGTNRNGLSTALASLGLAVMALGRRRKHSRRT